MKKSIGLVFLAFVFLTVLLSGCAPAPTPFPPTSTPVQTNTPLPTNTSLPTATPLPTNTPLPTDTPVLLLKSIAGMWVGVDKGTLGGDSRPGREIEVTILADCSIGSICGTATGLINGELCVSNLTLIEIKDETYTFEGMKKEGSASFCGEGGSYTLKPIPDGTLSYALDSYNSAGKRIEKTAILNLRSTLTEAAGSTPSGKFEFFDVSLDQAGKDTVNISFGYQLEKGLDPNGLQIMAQLPTKGTSISCNTMNFSTFAKPYILKGDVAGIVKGADVAILSMTKPAKCSFKGFTLVVIRLKGSSFETLYKQDFEIPFTLEK
jgi:hypothetical protein